jgi:cell division protein FtsW
VKTLSKDKQAAYYYDYWLILAVSIITMIGFLLLASASMGISNEWFHNSLYFLSRQAIYLVIGVIVISLVKRIPLIFWEKISGYLLLSSVLLLILVLVPGIGREVKGSTRWIGFSVASLQVSELTKFSLIIYLASYLLRHQDEARKSIRGFINPLLILGIISVLLILEPDFGAIVVILITTLGIMYLAGVRLWQFIVLFALISITLGTLAIISPYRVLRLTSFLNPWLNPYDSGYQLVQSLIAFGRGGIFGVGLGNSIQKLFYLPEVHTDFLFAVLAEEFGIFGQITIISLFSFLIARIFYLGRLASKIRNRFASYSAYGIGLLIGIQVIINIGVNTGLLPTKGLTLPFMSYGGSSLIFNCLNVAILLRIHHEVVFKATFTPHQYYF